ncbi:hypothetical protein RUND412_005379 [Rhizina undulata]
MPVPPWYQLRLFSGDLYGNEDKSKKPSKSEDVNVVTDIHYTPSASSSSSSSSFSTSHFTLASSTSCLSLLAPPRATTATSTVTQQAGIFSFSSTGFQVSSLPRLFFSQVTKITNELANAGISVDVNAIQRVLRGRYANGDPDKALELLNMIEDSNDGIVTRVRSDVMMLGAENNGGVTCYMDTLFFAMFARLDAFEAILYNVFDEEDKKRRKLAALIRLFVNLLRSGKLITTDIILQIQQSLAECGWEGAISKDQQDTSELFTFLTDTLQLPLLTVKVDIAHGGKEMVDDDHKFISERLLNVPLPKEFSGSKMPLRLEDCLDEYFGSRVEIKRKLERRATGDSARSSDSFKGNSLHIETRDLGSNPASPAATPILSSSSNPALPRNKLPIFRTVLGQSEGDEGDVKVKSYGPVRAEVLVPAWCFFSILPFYTDSSSTVPSTYAEHFSTKRPVLGMCLKRYNWTPNGAVRDPRPVEIPLEIALPKFVTDDEMRDDDGLVYGNFKLVLQSAVCHRGESINSGHYIALVRGDEGKWLLFDDLDINERVSEVNPNIIFEKESPYLLFYQVQPIDEEISTPTASSFESLDAKSAKRLSLVSTGSIPSHADFDIQEPPRYQKHEPGVGSASPPPPYRHHSHLDPKLLHEPGRDMESLRPSSRSMRRPRSKDGGPKSRSGSDGSQKRSSWTSSLRRSKGKGQDKERRSGELRRNESERDKQRRDSGDEATEDAGGTDNEQLDAPESQPSEQERKKEKRRSRDKGKGKERHDSSGKREKEDSQCTLQ